MSSIPIISRPFFFFNDTATTEIYTLSLHDALPIDAARRRQQFVQDSIAREQARRDSLARSQQDAERLRRQRESDSLAAMGRDVDAVRAMVGRAVHFDFDKSNIRPGDDTQILDEKVSLMQANPGLTVEISGHADERGSDEYNL